MSDGILERSAGKINDDNISMNGRLLIIVINLSLSEYVMFYELNFKSRFGKQNGAYDVA